MLWSRDHADGDDGPREAPECKEKGKRLESIDPREGLLVARRKLLERGHRVRLRI